MEVKCGLPCLRSVKSMHRISFWDDKQLGNLSQNEQEQMRYIIDTMGHLSAQAQQLRMPITDYNRIRTANHNLYLCTTGISGKLDSVLVKGMLKVGVKNLYIRQESGQLVQISPLCVLDFYVHEDYQRQGLGHELYDIMLERENKCAHELGIDRPSTKLLSFLAKYYNLIDYLPQANQFVVFKDYFNERNVKTEMSFKRPLVAAAAAPPQVPVFASTSATPHNELQSSRSRNAFNNNFVIMEGTARKKEKILYGRRAHTCVPDEVEEQKKEQDHEKKQEPHVQPSSLSNGSPHDFHGSNHLSPSKTNHQFVGRRANNPQNSRQIHLSEQYNAGEPNSGCSHISSHDSSSSKTVSGKQGGSKTSMSRREDSYHSHSLDSFNPKFDEKDLSSILKIPSTSTLSYPDHDRDLISKRELRVRFADQCCGNSSSNKAPACTVAASKCDDDSWCNGILIGEAHTRQTASLLAPWKHTPALFRHSSSFVDERHDCQGYEYAYGGGRCDKKPFSVTSIPTSSFQSTRSCYHASMQGLGAAQAMSFI